MTPKLIHCFDSDLDAFNIFNGLVDHVRGSELFGIATVVFNLVLENFELIKDTAKFLNGDGDSTFILEEFSLSHLLGEMSNLLFERFDVLVVVFFLVINQWLDLFLDILG
jgi:hypothetical protein